MAFAVGDRIKETTTTTGTGALTLAGAVTKFRAFSSILANNDTTYYAIEHQAANEWEVGLGTWGTGNILTRTTIISSSNANAAVNFSAGTKNVIGGLPAARALFLDVDLAMDFPVATANPAAAAAGRMKLFGKKRAGRMLLSAIGPAGVDYNMQPALFGNNVVLWIPTTGTTVALSFGTAWTARNAGTSAAQAHPAPASTNDITAMKRATFGTGTTATGSSGIQGDSPQFFRGNAAGRGGFFFFARLGIEALSGTYRLFVGLSALNAALAGEPSVQNNSIVLGKDSGDATLQIITRDGSAFTKTNTTVTPATTQVLDLYIFCKPNDTKITVRLVDAVAGTVYMNDVDITANLPANTTFLYPHAQIMSATGTTAKLLALNRLYVESDL